MSDGKEVKRYILDSTPIYLVGESTPEPTTCVVLGRDHDRIVAERNAEQKLLVTKVIDLSRYVDELRAELNQLKMMYDGLMVSARITRESNAKTIATQARVIEKLKANVAHDEECASFDDHKCDCWRSSFFETVDAELAAIEKEGAKDESHLCSR